MILTRTKPLRRPKADAPAPLGIIEVTGANLSSKLAELAGQGALVSSMSRLFPQNNAVYRLTVHWPVAEKRSVHEQELLFADEPKTRSEE